MQYMQPWKSVRGFERFSLCDWPGKTCCVIFLGGCNLHCPTCHNATMAWHHDTLPTLDQSAMMRFLQNRTKWLDGVTITGGEPTTVDGLETILADIHALGYAIKLDTNAMNPGVVADMLATGYVTTFAVDVKGPYEKYPALTGNAVSAETAQHNVERIFAMAQDNPGRFYFRTTRVPLLTDTDIETVRGYLPAGSPLTEQKYIEPRRTSDAQTDSETGRMHGDVVTGADCECHPEGAASQRGEGSAALQATGS